MNCNTTHYRANSSSVPGDPTGSNSAGTEDGSVNFVENLHVMSAMAHRLSDPAVRAQVNDRVALLKELYALGYKTQNPHSVIQRIALLQNFYRGDALRGMQAHFRDVIDRLEVDPRFRGSRSGKQFTDAMLKEVGLQYPLKPGRKDDAPNPDFSQLRRLVFEDRAGHGTELRKLMLQHTIEAFGKTSSALDTVLKAVEAGGEVAAAAHPYLKDWRCEQTNDFAQLVRALGTSLEARDAKSASLLYALLSRNRPQHAAQFDAMVTVLSGRAGYADAVKNADLTAKPYTVNWHDGRPLSGISPNELLAEIRAEVEKMTNPANRGAASNSARTRAGVLLRQWVQNRRVKPFRPADATEVLRLANQELFFVGNSDFIANALLVAGEVRVPAEQHVEAVNLLRAAGELLNHPDMDLYDGRGTRRQAAYEALKPELDYRVRASPVHLTEGLVIALDHMELCRVSLASLR